MLGLTRITPSLILCTLSVLLLVAPLAADAQQTGPRQESSRFTQPRTSADQLPAITNSREAARKSPTAVRFVGGLLGSSATLVGLLAATWNDPDAVPPPILYGGYALGTAAVTAAVTAIWEKPNQGLVFGALAGAAPLIIAMSTDADSGADAALLISWITAPLGATIGQALGRRADSSR